MPPLFGAGHHREGRPLSTSILSEPPHVLPPASLPAAWVICFWRAVESSVSVGRWLEHRFWRCSQLQSVEISMALVAWEAAVKMARLSFFRTVRHESM